MCALYEGECQGERQVAISLFKKSEEKHCV